MAHRMSVRLRLSGQLTRTEVGASVIGAPSIGDDP